MGMPFVDDLSANVARQRPALPNTDFIAWTPDDRLYRSVEVDFISGMSQRSYVFSKPNQDVYRDMLRWSLDRAGLLAETRAEARYALSIAFSELDVDSFGGDLAGRSTATYTLTDRFTGRVVGSRTISAYFLNRYKQLNEDDFALAYGLSSEGVQAGINGLTSYAVSEGLIVELINNKRELRDYFDGPILEASQATWDDVTQTFVWVTGLSLVAGPLEILREQLDPTNYIAFANPDERAAVAPEGARRGALSEEGYGPRSAGKRARQAGNMMLAQSLTKYIIQLASDEGVTFTPILPCRANAEVDEAKEKMLAQGIYWTTEACDPSIFIDDPGGFQFTRLK